jgi:hypothetical protein
MSLTFIHRQFQGRLALPQMMEALEVPDNDNDDFFGLRVNGQKLWEAKYRFRKEMLPAFRWRIIWEKGTIGLGQSQ